MFARKAELSSPTDLEGAARTFLLAALEDSKMVSEALWRGGSGAPRGGFVTLGGLGLPGANGDHRAVFVLHDRAEPAGHGLPFRATLQFADGRWKLVSIESACASCFGLSILEPEMRPCETCLASGWGRRPAPTRNESEIREPARLSR